MPWLTIMWFTIFIYFLPLFISTTSSGFHLIFTIQNMDKCEDTFEKQISERLKDKEFMFEIKTVSYSLVNFFLVLGIRLNPGRVCLCIWNRYLLLVSCFCFWQSKLFNCLRSIFANQLYKWKTLVGGGGIWIS